jgi:hypothetical protein
MPASTLSGRSVALLRVHLDECFGRPINFPRKLHKNLSMPLLRDSTSNTSDHAGKGYIHHVLLCEHRRPQEYR